MIYLAWVYGVGAVLAFPTVLLLSRWINGPCDGCNPPCRDISVSLIMAVLWPVALLDFFFYKETEEGYRCDD